MYWKRRNIYLIIITLFSICLSSCTSILWPNEKDFFEPFKVWETENKELVVACQGAGGCNGFGQITYLNKNYDVNLSFISGGFSGFSTNVRIWFENDENEPIGLSFKKRRIKNGLFSYCTDRLELYKPESISSDEYWNSDSIILYSRNMNNDELDARFYGGWRLVNEDEKLVFKPFAEKEESFEWVLTTTLDDKYYLIFTDVRSFYINGPTEYYGNYSPYDRIIELHFDSNNPFLGLYESLRLELK